MFEKIVTQIQEIIAHPWQKDPNHRMIAGVCSGIALRYRMNPLWIRIILVFVTLKYPAAGVLIVFIYCVLWYFMTTPQKTLPTTQWPETLDTPETSSSHIQSAQTAPIHPAKTVLEIFIRGGCGLLLAFLFIEWRNTILSTDWSTIWLAPFYGEQFLPLHHLLLYILINVWVGMLYLLLRILGLRYGKYFYITLSFILPAIFVGYMTLLLSFWKLLWLE